LLKKLYDYENSSTATDLVTCLKFFFYIGDFEKYEELAEKINDMHYEDGEDLLVKGWRLCFSNDITAIKEGQKMFQSYIERFGPGNIDALMGGFKCMERLKENEEILDAYGEIGTLFQNFYPLHIEKCKIFLNLSDFENAIDYINSKVNFKHFEIYKCLAVCNLISEGNFSSALVNIDKMWEQLCKDEPKNPELYFSCSQLFARICEYRPAFIRKCEIMVDKALEFSPRNARYLIEKGFYLLRYGEIEKALKIFTNAGEIDVNNKESMIGVIFCKILNGKLKEAQEDIDFLKEICYQGPKLMFYETLIKLKMGEKEDVIGALVSETLNTHVKQARSQLFTKYEVLIMTEFDFLYDLAKSKIIFYQHSSPDIL
jgi:tetratricopeptide repeat protein 21B